MAVAKVIFDTTYQIPQTEEENWGAQGTAFLSAVADALGATVTAVVASNTLAASATLTPTAQCHRVQGSGGAVTLDTTTPIAAGTIDGQELELEGVHATNTVMIDSTSTNVDLNGDVILGTDPGFSRVIQLRWNSSRSVWVERSRSH